MDSSGIESIPIGQLLELRKNGKEFHRDRPIYKNEHSKKAHKRENKSCPREVSSKRRIREKKEVDSAHEIRDPRFEGLSGKFNYDLYRKSYKFIEKKQDEEIKEMKKAMRKSKGDTEKREIQSNMTRVVQQKIDRDRIDRKTERKREYMKTEREAVSKGKKPFFPKRREAKEAELKDRFDALSKRGKLNKYMEKKRRRNAFRDEANMPNFREREE